MTVPERGEYHKAHFALLTLHQKERAIAPVLERAFEATLEVISSFDTDTLGTFTREIPRRGTQLEAARSKARLCISQSGCALGLGSEGAFSAGPFGLGSTNTELIVLLDDNRGLEVIGQAAAPGHHHHGVASGWEELEHHLSTISFPSHGVTLRPDDENAPRVTKALDSWEGARAAFRLTMAISTRGLVFFESELRAHLNPTRMQTIAAAAEDLVSRLATTCPRCACPGFGPAGVTRGLPCEDCGAPTNAVRSRDSACPACLHRRSDPVAEPAASARWCPHCNP